MSYYNLPVELWLHVKCYQNILLWSKIVKNRRTTVFQLPNSYHLSNYMISGSMVGLHEKQIIHYLLLPPFRHKKQNKLYKRLVAPHIQFNLFVFLVVKFDQHLLYFLVARLKMVCSYTWSRNS